MAQGNLGLFLRERKHGFERRVGLLTGRAYLYAFSTKKSAEQTGLCIS